LLNHGQTFNSVKGALAFDWLARSPAMPWYSLETLFGIAATHDDRAQLNALIEARCNDPIDPSDSGVRRRKFWLLRDFFFILPTSGSRWSAFSADPKAIFQIEQYAGRFARHDMVGWPQLNRLWRDMVLGLATSKKGTDNVPTAGHRLPIDRHRLQVG
jgi:hypothetical protein